MGKRQSFRMSNIVKVQMSAIIIPVAMIQITNAFWILCEQDWVARPRLRALAELLQHQVTLPPKQQKRQRKTPPRKRQQQKQQWRQQQSLTRPQIVENRAQWSTGRAPKTRASCTAQ